MLWTAFEIAINLFQGYLLLMYVKECFTYENKHPIADVLVVCASAGLLTYFLFAPFSKYGELLLFSFSATYAFTLSSENKWSVGYWYAILVLIFSMVSTVTYPIFELVPTMMYYRFPSYLTERFACIITTNILLYVALKAIIRLKKDCPLSSTRTYIAFILTLIFAYMVDQGLYALFLDIGDTIHTPFFFAYVGLISFTAMVIVFFRIVSHDAEQKNKYQTEIAVLNMTKQHQSELATMYETLTARQHDYKHHLQTLGQLVSSGNPAAKEYLESISEHSAFDEMIVTGSPEVDALLTVKRQTMQEKGIQFKLTPYPLAELPISPADFCAILGNLLDNAIEGIGRITNPSKAPLIHLSFSRSWDMFYIYCTNPCEPTTLKKKNGAFLSSKTQSKSAPHGIGLHSIKAIANQAQGRAEFIIQDDEFHAKVVLPFIAKAQN